MNFFDTWDIAREPTPQPPAPGEQQGQALNDEVDQVIGQLGRFWGTFRSQGAKALETGFEIGKKGFGDVVVQAQKELGKLSAPQAQPTEGEPSGTRELPTDAAAAQPTDEPTEPQSPSATTSAGLFSRLQAALPPNLVATVQSHIPDSVRHASENVDLTQIRTNLLSEFQRVQGITRAQAEEYAHKGEAYLREVVREANEVLKDAVQIIPPSPQGEGGSGFVWDGTDMWMLPTESAPGAAGEATTEAGSSRQAGETQTAVASRALALLHRLQTDPTIIKHDPAAEDGVKEQYAKWISENVESKGGINGSEWNERSQALLKENTDLYEMYTSIVPAEIAKEDFWQRYFFRAHQITAEEERRKALLQASTTESDEDFSWEGSEDEEEGEEGESSDGEEDDDDDSSTSSKSPANKPESVKTLSPKTDETESSRPSGESTRISSEDSYDVVSSAAASVGDLKKPTTPAPAPKAADSDSDSDWE